MTNITIKRHMIRGCCGNKTFVLEMDVPIGRDWLAVFKSNGYQTSDIYTKSNIFYVCKGGLTANGPLGGNKLQVRSSSANASVLLDHLENTIRIALMPKGNQ
jgi:hypothetical protein